MVSLLSVAVLAPAPAAAARPARSRARRPRPTPIDPIPTEIAARKYLDNSGNMVNLGGPVMHSETTYPIFWDPGGKLHAKTKSLITQYLKDVAHDSGSQGNVYSVLSQYTDSSGHAAYRQRFGGAFTDTHAYPANDPSCLTYAYAYPPWPAGTPCLEQSQIVAELSGFISSHSLPTGMSSVYFIFTPDGVPVCQQSGLCNTTWCAFHSHVGAGKQAKLYAVIPTSGTPGRSFAEHCGHNDGGTQVQEPNGDLADVAINMISHELSETITDPLVGSPFTDPSSHQAWLSGYSEVSDKCQDAGPAGFNHDPNAFLPVLGGSATKGTLYDQLINGHRYYTQSNWSNKDGACKMREGSARPPNSSFSFKGKPRLNRRRGTAILSVVVPGPGRLALKGGGVASVRSSVARAAGSLAQLAIRPIGATRRRLAKRGKLSVKVSVTYTPTGGTAHSKSESVHLVEHKPKRGH